MLYTTLRILVHSNTNYACFTNYQTPQISPIVKHNKNVYKLVSYTPCFNYKDFTQKKEGKRELKELKREKYSILYIKGKVQMTYMHLLHIKVSFWFNPAPIKLQRMG